ncbi:dihydrolipoyl dehydrogenase family protein [Mycetocola zhujimingii]|uniref:Pyridine nucleotide-disulfide oxidoreductase n=1 Tax=Mycetocola zhujimingii TaxID=2079792 RepID=A0A2U1TAH0_9MICO|nr:NAD(P)/FAD-dependent oxidoreductase [Mycetocola zhujimingii]PWC04689.1 pyridine nucleotide-disulfide oxidoreductase [Mycetocola zhujimingii]
MAGAFEGSAPDYDLIVIGAGPVGENVADYAAKRGIRVAIVESELVGGECSYWACMPSKALLRSGHVLRAAQRLDGTRQAVTGELDVPAVLARRNTFTSEWKDDGQVDWLNSAGIDLIRGHARLTVPRTLDVNGRAYTARAVAVATGSVPVLPDIPGLAVANPWGTREATSASAAPARLLVLGGGVAGTELATAWASLGSDVTLLSRGPLLEREEPFAGELVTKALREMGVDVRIGVSPTGVHRDEAGVVTTTLDDGSTVVTDEILVSTGRRPNTLDLGVDTVGFIPGEKLSVDDTMLVTGTDWLYAVGDVNGRALLTHQGKYQARAAGEVIAARLSGGDVHDAPWGGHVATADHAAVPHVIFTDPEVAGVGLTEAQARARGLNVTTVEYDLGWVAGAKLHADGYEGHAKLVIDEDRHVIAGATFVGQDVADLLHSATIAIVGEVPIDRLWHAVPSYPTISEVWLRLLETYGRPN